MAFLLRVFARLYLFIFYGAAGIILKNDKILLDAFKRALAGESRLVIAFRHPSGGEPQILTWFFLFKLPFIALGRKVRFAKLPHSVFVYSYEVVRWGGPLARFIMPRIGAMPIHHAKMDSKGMDRIYNTILEGVYPLALAPEGQVSYTEDSVPRLEPGVIRIGFNAAERLAAKEKPVPLEILPLSVHFRFGSRGRFAAANLLGKLEVICGFSRRGKNGLSVLDRVKRCREHILKVNESRYNIKSDESLVFGERLERVIDAALLAAERMLGIKGSGDHFARMYMIRQLCWDRIFLPNLESFKGKSKVERSVMDLEAGEAWYISRHQELVDFCWYFRVPLPEEDAAFHNKIEYMQNLWDFANRTMGGAYNDRINISPKKIIIHASPAINMTARLPAYKSSKKEAVAAAMDDLEKAYLDSVKEANSWGDEIKTGGFF